MNICLICGSEIPQNQSKCLCCGEYPVRVIGENTLDMQQILQQRAKEKRDQKLQDISVGLRIYHLKDKQLTPADIIIGVASQLFHHEIWLKESFAPACGLSSLDIECILDKEGIQQSILCSIPAPEGEGTLHIGAVLENGFQLYLLVKNNDNEVRSQSIALF